MEKFLNLKAFEFHTILLIQPFFCGVALGEEGVTCALLKSIQPGIEQSADLVPYGVYSGVFVVRGGGCWGFPDLSLKP